jgi:Histone methylation protein DOT1.
MVCCFESAETLIKELNITDKDVFYDLGCGVGKLVMQVGLTTPVKKASA